MKVIKFSEFKLLLQHRHMMGQPLAFKKYLIVVDDKYSMGHELMGLPENYNVYNLNGQIIPYSYLDRYKIIIFTWHY
jgi:hypothetical protein